MDLFLRLLKSIGPVLLASVLWALSQPTLPQNGCGPNGCSGGSPGGSTNQVQSNAGGGNFGGIANGATGTVLTSNGPGSLPTFQAVSGTGTVTTVSASVPGWESVTVATPTTTPAITITAATGQTANSVLASPNGTTGALSVRALVGADIPAINLAGTGNGGITGVLPLTNFATCVASEIPFASSSTAATCSTKLEWSDSTTTLSMGLQGQVAILQAPTATTTNTAGGSFTEKAGNGLGTGAGGTISAAAGSGGTTGTAGGVTFNAGNSGTSSNNPGGSENFNGGQGHGTGAGGAINISGGLAAGSGAGGAVAVTGGTANGVGAGGASTLAGGQDVNGDNPGQIVLPGAPGSGASSNIIISPVSTGVASSSAGTIIQDALGDNTLYVDAFGNIVCTCNTSTTATDGFSYLGAVTGKPTGAPAHVTGSYANSTPIRYDTANQNLWAYNGTWVSAVQSPSQLSYQPGFLSTIVNTKSVFSKVTHASTVENIEGSAQSLTTCTTNPTITMYECGTSATCASPTTIGTVTITATGQAFDGTVSSSAITAGDYVGWAISAGACVSLDIAATAQIHAN